MTESFDFVVLGGGSAGYAAASTAARAGLSVAVVEGGREVGGLCILRGCMPSKALLESSHRAEVVRNAAEFGLKAQFLGVDGPAIQMRKRRLVEEFAAYRRGQLEGGRFKFYRAHARFEGSHRVRLALLEGGESWIEGRAFLIATGSRPAEVEIPGLAGSGCWGSDEVLESESIPESVVVLGGGAVAVELASYFAGFGRRVSLVQRSSQLLREVDADVAQALAQGLSRRGVSVFCGTAIQRVESGPVGSRVIFTQGGEELCAEGVQVVAALGRVPALQNLGLESAGVRREGRRVQVSLSQQTSAPHIFAAGDVCGPCEVVHLAVQQGEVAARNAVNWLKSPGAVLEEMDYRLKLFAVFSHPEVASVGLTQREAADAGVEVDAASYPFNDHGRSMVAGEVDGFVKLIVARGSREILGAAAVGPQAAELIHEPTVAMHLRARAMDLARVPHYHPTLSEIWTYPAEELA
jgi:pyruvate/2-oxoglutarate dehydrogenase complex dihydrolipoamide dehydrogenase (E3) component